MFREATEHDLLPLAELERAANVVGLAHVFPPERFPFPFDAVLARWRLVLDDPAAVVLVLDEAEEDRLAVYVAYDDSTLRHIAVHPDRWGEGLATAGMTEATRAMARRGSHEAFLWVLEENHRARRLYERLGWVPTDDRREAPWPPHPMEVSYVRPLTGTEEVTRR
ncbi:MAG TPA: GNAT family N-acetyltransferase [Nocardioidaceae bacterium]|nr:GNAT family N-acetyltransferase [Nocardioidaceae bacterium]